MDEKDLKIFNLSMELWKAKHSYEYSRTVEDIKETKNLMEVNNYYTRKLRELIIEFGYVAIENYFIEKANE